MHAQELTTLRSIIIFSHREPTTHAQHTEPPANYEHSTEQYFLLYDKDDQVEFPWVTCLQAFWCSLFTGIYMHGSYDLCRAVPIFCIYMHRICVYTPVCNEHVYTPSLLPTHSSHTKCIHCHNKYYYLAQETPWEWKCFVFTMGGEGCKWLP